MKIPPAKGYSIWLMFKNEDEIKLQNIINELSEEFSSPLFKPHVTLLSGIETEEDLREKFSKVIENLNSFDIKIKDIKCSEEFYKSLFLEVEIDEYLNSLYLKAVDTFNFELQPLKFQPHISLLYSDNYNSKKNMAAKRIENLKNVKLTVNKIALVRTNGCPSEWRELINIHF